MLEAADPSAQFIGLPETLQIIDPPKGFKAQFDAVLNRIPKEQRDAILQYWAEVMPHGVPYRNSVVFREGVEEGGCTRQRGREIVFNRTVWRDKDEGYISDLIAHELAHVYDWCAGPAKEVKDERSAPPETEVKMERRAVETALQWGFTLPGGKSPQVHYKQYAVRCLNGLPFESFPSTHPSREYMLKVAESGDVPL